MQCPKDKKPLRSLPAQDFVLDVCDECGGVWFEGEELKNAMRSLAQDHTHDKKEFARVIKDNDIPDDKRKNDLTYGDGAACPFDGVMMQHFVYAGDSRVILEQCARCGGTWFDGDELMRVAEYVKPRPLYDAMGKAIIRDMKETERAKQEFTEMMSSPSGMLIFLGNIAVRAMLIWADRKPGTSPSGTKGRP